MLVPFVTIEVLITLNDAVPVKVRLPPKVSVDPDVLATVVLASVRLPYTGEVNRLYPVKPEYTTVLVGSRALNVGIVLLAIVNVLLAPTLTVALTVVVAGIVRSVAASRFKTEPEPDIVHVVPEKLPAFPLARWNV